MTRQLARILDQPVDAATRTRATLHVLDWIGCAVIGATEPAGRVLRSYAASAASGTATGLGQMSCLVPEQAAFLNGGLGNVLEMDDVHRTAILHPGPVIIPAALAMAEQLNTPSAVLLDAIVRGYEAEIRIGSAVGPGHYALWHNTSTCGPFGAAAAVAGLLTLNEDQTVWALGNAGTQSSGPWRCRHEAVMTKQLHTAQAAQAGLVAARLAAAGFTGPEYLLEGEQGFFQAMCPDPLPERITAEFDGWQIWETSFKPWPACRHAHAAIDAALEIRTRHAPQVSEIASITIQTYGESQRFCDRMTPTTGIEAKFSLQHAVAVALTDGPPTLDAFAVSNLVRADIAALRDVSAVTVYDRFETAFPAHYGSAVDITLHDDTTLSATAADALGDPENPLSSDQIAAKARQLMAAAGVPERDQDRLVQATFALADGGPLADLTAALRHVSKTLSEHITP